MRHYNGESFLNLFNEVLPNCCTCACANKSTCILIAIHTLIVLRLVVNYENDLALCYLLYINICILFYYNNVSIYEFVRHLYWYFTTIMVLWIFIFEICIFMFLLFFICILFVNFDYLTIARNFELVQFVQIILPYVIDCTAKYRMDFT